MNARWRMVVGVVVSLASLTACGSSGGSQVAPDPTPSATSSPSWTPTTEATPSPLPTTSPSPSKASKTPRVPPSWPTRLEIGGAHPIDAAVLLSDSPTPPDDNFADAFVWTARGMPGDGAKDTTYIIGHTYRGDVKGVFDDLQYVKPGTPVRLTTSEGQLDYCVHDVLPPILKDQILDPTRGDVWNILPYSAQGDWVVFIACFLNDDGSPQDHNIVVRAKRGPC